MAGAYAKIEAHEDLCAERYKNIHGRVDAVLSEIKEQRDEQKQGRNWMRTAALGVMAWLALQVYEFVTSPPPVAAPAVTVLNPPAAAPAS